jgi:prepilin-type N-terminal cleavage/methylation domain-containing protein
MKKGFTLIEVILAMVITLIMVMVASTIIINVMQTFNSEAEVIDVRGDLSIIEARLEGIFRNENSDIIIYEDESVVPNSDFVCYYYNLSEELMKEVNNSNSTDAIGFKKALSNNYEISAIRFEKSTEIDNGIDLSFYIQLKGDSSTEQVYQDLTLSTLNPHIVVEMNGTNDNNNNMLCFK